jgi:hypothetical protein
MANKVFATVVAPDGTQMPIQYVDIKGDGSLFGLIIGAVPVDATGAPMKTGSAAQLALQSGNGALLEVSPGTWAVSSNPAAGTAASASKAAGGAGVRHVLTGIIVILSATTALAGITTVTINIRDGAAGAGTILAALQVTLGAATLPPTAVPIPPLNIPGSAATAMTIEGSAAVGNLMESITMIGYDAS